MRFLLTCSALLLLLAACAQQSPPVAQGLEGLYGLRSVQYGAGAQLSASGARSGSLLISGGAEQGGTVSITLDDGVDPARTFTGVHTLSDDGRDVVAATRGQTLSCGGTTFSSETLTLNFFGRPAGGQANAAYLAAGEVSHPVCSAGQIAYHKSSFRNLYLSR